MKTLFLSLGTALLLTSGIANFAQAASSVKTQNLTVVKDITVINKIEVYGNVKLFISDGSADEVKVYNQYYSESALIQSRNGVLRISSYKNEKLVVWVTAADLRSIAAYDNAEISSFGQLSKIDFDVNLHDNASAKLSLDVFTANVTLTGHAKADIAGSADELNLQHSLGASVNNFNFSAIHFHNLKTDLATELKSEDIATL